MALLEFECHLDIQEYSSNNVCSKWRMKIQTEQNKPHRKQTSFAQEFIVSFHQGNFEVKNGPPNKKCTIKINFLKTSYNLENGIIYNS